MTKGVEGVVVCRVGWREMNAACAGMAVRRSVTGRRRLVMLYVVISIDKAAVL